MRSIDANAHRFSGAIGRRFVVAAILLFAYGLRLNCLDCQSLWLDEAASAYWTATPLPELFRDTADNLHVPGYYLLLRAWVNGAGMTPFSLRYFSLLGGVLTVAVAYTFSRRYLGGPLAALFAAILAATSPALIYYSQETRMYAFLPALFLLMIAVALELLSRPRRRLWLLLIAGELVALYFHLFSALMLLAINVYIGIHVLRRNAPRRAIRSWLTSQLIVLIALLPWLIFLWRSGGALPANLGDTSGGAATFTLAGYLGQLWTFLLTGLTGVRPFLIYWSALLALVLVAGYIFGYAKAGKNVRDNLIAVLLAVLIPILGGSLAWRFNPLTHPRYLFFLLGPLTVLAAFILAHLYRRPARLPFALALTLLIFLVNAASLHAARFDSTQWRYDARALSAAIAARGGEESVALMPPYDRSLWFYDPSPVTAANWPFAEEAPARRPALLQQTIGDAQELFLVEYHDLYSYDPHRQIPYLLEQHGHLLEQFTVDRMDVYHYAVTNDELPSQAPRDDSCGPFTLTAAAFPSETAPGDAPAIALQWRLEQPVQDAFVASIRLMDGEQILASDDRSLLNAEGQPTTRWQPGQQGTTYAILPFPLGAPPLSYQLNVLLYAEGGEPLACGSQSEALPIGQIALSHADRRESDAYGSWAEVSWQQPEIAVVSPGLLLEGYNIRPSSLLPGEPLFVTLRWRASSDSLPPTAPLLQLRREETIYSQAGSDLFTRYPVAQWQDGDIFIETRELTMPATAGPLQLEIAASGSSHPLQPVQVDLQALQWDVPHAATPLCAQFEGVGRLVAYDWQPSGEGEEARLVLYWQGDEHAPADLSYTVFTQLLAPDLNIIAQHDGLPAGGRRPTTTWLPQEIIADEHPLKLPTPLPADASLNIGLYELQTLQRVPAYSCDDRRLQHDGLAIPLAQLE